MKRLINSFSLILLGCLSLTCSSAQTQIGLDINGSEAFDFFGGTLDLSENGNRLIVGAFNNTTNGFNAGLTRVYELSEGVWIQLGADILGTGSNQELGASVAISSNGNRIAIGAPGRIGVVDFAGEVRVYEWVNESWVQLGASLAGDLNGELFGTSVSLSSDGEYLAVGAPLKKGIPTSTFTTGQVRVYSWSGEGWVQKGSDINGMQDDFVGNAVSLSADGSRLAVDAIGNRDNGAEAGQARVYEWQNNDWTQLGININGASGDFLGCALDLSSNGNRLAIGARGLSFNGKVKVYEWMNDTWIQMGEDFSGETGDFLGCSVDLSANGQRLAIGALGRSENGFESGQAQIFEWSNGGWIQIGMNINGEENSAFGEAVALSADGNLIAVGATFDTQFGLGLGKVQVFDLSLVSSIDQENISSTNVFPNPTIGILYFEEDSPKSISIIDLYGRIVFREANVTRQLNIHHLSKGIYILKMNIDGKHTSFKLVKQ